MAFGKNFLIVLLVVSTINLCLAMPRWMSLHKKNHLYVNDEISTRRKNDETLADEWKRQDDFGKKDVMTKKCLNRPICLPY